MDRRSRYLNPIRGPPRTFSMFVELLRDFLGKKAGERLHVAAEEGQRLIASGVAKAVADDPLSAAINRGVEDALAGLVNANLRQFADAQAQSRRLAVPALFGPH